MFSVSFVNIMIMLVPVLVIGVILLTLWCEHGIVQEAKRTLKNREDKIIKVINNAIEAQQTVFQDKGQ